LIPDQKSEPGLKQKGDENSAAILLLLARLLRVLDITELLYVSLPMLGHFDARASLLAPAPAAAQSSSASSSPRAVIVRVPSDPELACKRENDTCQ
jgi:hypothetical protein